MQFGVSYFGVRNPRHVERDLDDIRRLGFDYVVFTMSENDHCFYREVMARCVGLAHQRGLKAHIDPWGVCGVFGGEAFSDRGAWDIEAQQRRSDGRPLPKLCPNSDELRAYLHEWIKTVAEVLQADAIFWDEPHFYLPYGAARQQGLWSCCCHCCTDRFEAAYQHRLPTQETSEVRQFKQDSIVALINESTAVAATHGLKNIVCVLPDHDQPDALQAKFDRFAANPHLDVLATDPYPIFHSKPIATTERFCHALLDACQRYGKTAQLWIQGFRVAAGQEPLLGDEMQLIAGTGIEDMATWSYLATAYMSSHTCVDPDRVWAVFTHRMQDLRLSRS